MSGYTLLPFHRQSHPNLSFDGVVVAAAFDPGPANFAVRVELREGRQWRKTLLFEKLNFGGMKATTARKEEGKKVVRLWGDVLDYLDDRAEIFDRVNLFAPEKQLSPNHTANLLSQHFKSCLMQRYRDRPPYPVMMEVSPRLKSRVLCPDGEKLSYPQLKKASVAAATRLLEERGDQVSLDGLKASKKKDDLADTVIELEALFRELAV